GAALHLVLDRGKGTPTPSRVRSAYARRRAVVRGGRIVCTWLEAQSVANTPRRSHALRRWRSDRSEVCRDKFTAPGASCRSCYRSSLRARQEGDGGFAVRRWVGSRRHQEDSRSLASCRRSSWLA